MGPAFFLVCEDGTQEGLGRELNHALEAIWINTGSYYGHSFDVGTATEATLMRISIYYKHFELSQLHKDVAHPSALVKSIALYELSQCVCSPYRSRCSNSQYYRSPQSQLTHKGTKSGE